MSVLFFYLTLFFLFLCPLCCFCVEEEVKGIDKVDETEKTDKKEKTNQTKEDDKTKKIDEKKEGDKTKEIDENKESDKKEKVDEKKEQDASKKDPQVHVFTGYLTFVSDYRDRGISQTMRQPAIQGEMKYEHVPSGVYFKTWGSNVDGTDNFLNNTSLELNFYLGFTRKLCSTSFSVDAGLQFYVYPGGEAFVRNRTSYNSIEYYIQINYEKFNIVFHQTITDYFGVNSSNPPMNWNKGKFVRPNGHSYGSPYIEANWEIPVNDQLSLTLHGGYQAIINYPELNYFDWLAVLTYNFNGFELALAFVGTDAKRAFYDVPTHIYHSSLRKKLGATGVYAGITKKF